MKLELGGYKNLLSKYLRTQKLNVILLALVLVGNIGVQLINPQISCYFIDEAKKGAAVKDLTMVALMFIGIAFAQQLFNIASTYLGQNVAWRATNDIRIDLVKHCMNLDMSFHKEHQSGELIERVDGDVSELFNLFSNVALNILNNILLLIGILMLLFREGLIIGIGMTIFAVVSICFLWYVKTKTQGHWIKASKVNAEFYGFLGEQISSAEDIASSGARKYIMSQFYNTMRKMFPIINKANLTWATMWSATFIIFALGNVMAFGLSAYLWKKGLITIGTVYLIFSYTELLRRPIEQIRVNLQELQVSSASIVRIKELFDIKSKIKYGRDTFDVSKSLAVEVKNISFEYEAGVDVLTNVSLNVKEGKVLGILGHTACGKTTLARLLVRLYDVTSGEILLNSKNINTISPEELTKNIAYVTQNVQIFTASVRDNITMFNKNVEDETILNIIKDLDLMQWYEKFSKGLDTMLYAGGRNLSAGEAQLLAFVRAFLKNPRLIILDEATSRIDPITEQLIERALNKLLKNRTGIIIAHRLWTLQRADDILVLQNGRVIEFGSREKLLKNSQSNYYNLLQMGIEEAK
ncbi:ABC transporter ATP-binding protein [Clostridium tagluense]|nr:ABC transporter ATP-binding protein [Clostridium tagluense]